MSLATHCPECGVLWTEHLGCVGLCREVRRLQGEMRLANERADRDYRLIAALKDHAPIEHEERKT